LAGRVEFGIRLPVTGPLSGREAIASVARAADQMGFHTVWVHDHITWGREQDSEHISSGSREAVDAALERPDYAPLFHEALVSMSYVAGLTERVRIGVAVLCVPWRHPVVVAKQLATLDVLSNGRLTIGLGVGAPRFTHNQDFEVLGVPRDDKYRRTAEYLRVMQTVWTEERPSFEGEYISFPPTDLNPKPLQKPYPPLWLGGRGANAVELAADFAVGWIPGGLLPEEYPGRIRSLKRRAADRGRGEVDYTVAMEVRACVASSSDKARQISLKTAAVGVGAFAIYDDLDQVFATSLIGSPGEIRSRVEQYAEAGVRHFELKFVYHTIDHLLEQMEIWRDRVLPAFRS
jgi:probable F420-dependent oxidoreductase